MKIGVIIDFEAKPHNGGAYSYLSLFIKYLLSSNTHHKFIVVSPYTRQTLHETYAISDTQELYNLSTVETFKFRIFSTFRKTCQKFKIFSLLVHYLDSYRKKAYFNAFKEAGIQCICYLPYNQIYTLDIPFFFHVWDIGHRNINVFPEVSNDGQFMFREGIYAEVLPRAYRIIAETEAGKRDIEFYYRIKSEKIIVAPMFAGEVIHHEYNAEEAQLFLNDHRLLKDQFLFYPAQFWAHKNHVNLLHAFQELRVQYPNLKLVFCGGDKGNLTYIKEYIVKLDLRDHVSVLGFIDDVSLKILYKNALAMIMPTFLGPSNMPLLEAMALGCPVICTDSEGHRELTGNKLWYIDPQIPETISKAVSFLLNHPKEKETIIEAAKKYYYHSDNHIEKNIVIVLAEFDRFENVRRCWK